ncbi:DUF3465 domain-containing protein [Lysobacter xanthus]
MQRRPVSRIRYVAAVALLGLAVGCTPSVEDAPRADVPSRAVASNASLDEAMRRHAQDVPVEGEGVVSRVLRDDRDGSAHQRFLLRVGNDRTVLVAHNIDLAPRLDGLAEGDTVAFRGEYVWTPKGGTVHWTHRDPRGAHPDGWLRWRGRIYR